MKKIILSIAMVCVATIAQAATANWQATGGNMFLGNETDKFTGTAYVFATSIISQTDLYAAIANSGYDVASSSAASLAFANGAISSSKNTFDFGEAGKNYDMYFVILNGDDVYFSNVLANKAALNPPSQQALAFASQSGSKAPATAKAFKAPGNGPRSLSRRAQCYSSSVLPRWPSAANRSKRQED